MPVLGHGDAYAYPYGFTNWTVAALLWPLFGNWAVTLARVLGAVGCIVGDLRRVSRVARRLVGRGRARQSRDHRVAAVRPAGVRLGRGAAPVRHRVLAARAPARRRAARRPRAGDARRRSCCRSALLLVLRRLPFVPDRRALLRWYALSLADRAARAIVLVFASPGYADSTHARPARELRRHARARGCSWSRSRSCSCWLRRTRHPRARATRLVVVARHERRARRSRSTSTFQWQRAARARVEHGLARRLPALGAVRARRDLPRAARRRRRQARPLPRAARRRAARLRDVPGEHGHAQLRERRRLRAAALRRVTSTS